MTTDDYIKAIECLREMNTQTGYAISQLLGAVKGEAFKAKKMPEPHFMTIRDKT